MFALALGGCVSSAGNASWGARWPNGADLRHAAVSAAESPATWAPLAGAAALYVSGQDDDLSDWAADHRPLFGSDAESTSNHLRTASEVAWLVSALAAPSDKLTDKAGGLAVGVSTLALEGAVTRSVKNLADRRRPDGSNDQSFSSGHAGTSATATTLARRNLDYMDLAPWLDTSLRVGLHGLALGTGWARVEAGRHFVTDVLAGYALGNFIAAFMHESFMRSAGPAMDVSYQPLPGGGAVTLVIHRF